MSFFLVIDMIPLQDPNRLKHFELGQLAVASLPLLGMEIGQLYFLV